jgi:hypothetical protein
MGNLIIGKQGSGKSTALAGHRVMYHLAHPQDGMISLDSSGSFTDDFLKYASSLRQWPNLRHRIRYVRLGDDRWVLPSPALSAEYRIGFDAQIERIGDVFARLSEELKDAPILGLTALKAILPNLLRLSAALSRVAEDGTPWQLTEIGLLLDDAKALNSLIKKCGDALDAETRRFLYSRYANLKSQERELRSYSLSGILTGLIPDDARLQVGYYRPAWTPKEVMAKGLIVLIDGRRVVGRTALQSFLFTHYFALALEAVKQRQPHDERDRPFALIIDEVKNILKMPGMAREIEDVAPLYRSRKMQFYVVIQSLSQLDKALQESIWNMGNVMCFELLNKDDAWVVARQMLNYNPHSVKQEARIRAQNPITEPEQGQDRLAADWIANLKFRECLLRRHFSEKEKDRYIRHIRRTREVEINTDNERLEAIKQKLLEEHGVTAAEVRRAMKHRVQSLLSAPSPPKV